MKTLDPVEWSFREIDELELPIALEYELARSSPRIRKAVEALHADIVDGKTVRELLLGDASSGHSRAELHVFQSSARKDRIEVTWLKEFAVNNPLFPAAWNMLEPEDRLAFARQVREMESFHSDLHIWAVDTPGAANYFEVLRRDKGSGRASAIVSLDTAGNDSKDAIMATFSKWLDSALKGRRLKRGPGKIAAAWSTLKGLSALRLRESGLSFERAKDAIDAHVSMDPKWVYSPSQGGYKNRVLPMYSDSKDWYAAIRLAKRAIKDLESRFLVGVMTK